MIVLIPEALLDHNLNAKPKHFVYNLLEWLQPLLFFFDVKIVKGSYDSTDLYRWDSGDTLGIPKEQSVDILSKKSSILSVNESIILSSTS